MKRIEEIDVLNKRIILRCDFNVPINNNIIEDDTRIQKSLKTINYLLENNCKVIILSHLNRIKSEEDKLKFNVDFGASYDITEEIEANAKYSLGFGDIAVSGIFIGAGYKF